MHETLERAAAQSGEAWAISAEHREAPPKSFLRNTAGTKNPGKPGGKVKKSWEKRGACEGGKHRNHRSSKFRKARGLCS